MLVSAKVQSGKPGSVVLASPANSISHAFACRAQLRKHTGQAEGSQFVIVFWGVCESG